MWQGVEHIWQRKRECNDVQPAAIPCSDSDTQRRVLKTKGINKQADKAGAETSGGRTGGPLTCEVDQ
jgi:hypothetical protein